MKLKFKSIIVSIVLILIVVLGIVSTSILLDNKNLNEKQNMKFLYEVVEKRNEFSKVYKCSDGSYTAIMSDTPFHYYENNEWKEIDNSLIKDSNENYTNSANDFNVNLPVKISADSDITVKQNDYSVAFSLNGAETKSKGKVENAKVNNELSNDESLPNKNSSSITYKNVFVGTDIVYELEGKTLKENIIVDSFSDVKESYEFTISLNNLTAILNSDKSISLQNNDGETVFLIPSPVMYDAEKQFLKNITVSLTDSGNNTYSLTYTPDHEWLKQDNIKYPVTIDPVLQAGGMSAIRCATVISDNPDATVYDSTFNVAAHVIDENGEEYCADTYEKIYIEAFQGLLDDVTITEAQLLNACGAEGQFALKEISEVCDLSKVTYNTKPILKPEVIDYYTAPVGEKNELTYMHHNITQYLSDLIAGRIENNGLAITVTDDCAENSGAFMIGNAPQNGVVSPVSGVVIFVNYVETEGYDNRYNHHIQSVGDAGTVYVNDFTRRLFVSREELSLKNSDMSVNISMQYNPALYNYTELLEKTNSTETEVYCFPKTFGDSWLTNYNRGIYLSDYTDYPIVSFVTENGNVLSFLPVETTDENGKQQVLYTEERKETLGDTGYSVEIIMDESDTIDNASIRIIRPNGNIEQFDRNGRLLSITNSVDSSKKIEIHYVSNLNKDLNLFAIDYIIDDVGQKYDFVYDSTTNLLSYIYCISADGSVITDGANPMGLMYEYTVSNSGKNLLSKVTSSDGAVATYEYDSNDRLVGIINSDNQKYTYEYDSTLIDTVSKITEWIRPDSNSSFNMSNSIDLISSGPFQTTVKTKTQTEVYQFGKYGTPETIYNSDGRFINAESQGNNVSSLNPNYNNWNIISENYLSNSGFEEYFVETSSDAVNWINKDGGLALRVGNPNHYGMYGAYLNNSIGFNGYEQIVSTGNCDSATLSLYAKPGEEQLENNSFEIWCYAYNDNDEIVYFGHSTEFVEDNSDWKRYSVTANRKVTSEKLEDDEVDYFSVKILATDNTCVFIDDIQLEKHEKCSSYNLITDSLFTYDYTTPIGWETEDEYQKVNTTVNGHDYGAIEFSGGINNSYSISQTIYHNGTKGEVYDFGGWFNGYIAESKTDLVFLKENLQLFNFIDHRYSRIKVEYTYTDENSEVLTATEYINFNSHMFDWQYASSSFELKGNCSEFVVSIEYGHHPNAAYFTGIYLSLVDEAKQNNNKTDDEIINELPETGYYCLYETETNNSFSNANTMKYALSEEATYEIYGGFNCSGENKSNTVDNDYYKIKVNEDGKLFIDGTFIDNSQTDFTLSFILLDANHKQVAGSTLNSYGTSSEILSSTLAPGEYVICVFIEKANIEKMDAKYRLLLSFQPN